MKKTFTINISGTIFNIDEDAYNKLNAYLESIKMHFRKSEGGQEIINDIELRIAEILQEKLHETKQVITIEDINDVIETMGQPSQFDEEKDEESETATEDETYTAKNYKRLYRDPDNKIIGGVCSGIGAYFQFDPIWIRVLFIVSLFVGGFGLLLYIAFWIAIPEARTTAERLEMKGERVNVSNIEKSIRDEVSHLKDQLNDLTNKAKSTYKKKGADTKTVFEEIVSVFLSIFKIFVKIILIIIGIAIIITGITLLLSLFALVFNWTGFFISPAHDAFMLSFPVIFDNFLGLGFNMPLFKLGLILFLGVPFIMLLYLGARLLFGFERIRFLGLSAFAIWIIGLFIMAYFTFKTFNTFRFEASYEEIQEINLPLDKTIFVKLEQDILYDEFYDDRYYQVHDAGFILTEDGKLFCTPKLRIRKSNTDKVELEMYATARGKSLLSAKERAETIELDYDVNDSLLIIDPVIELGEDAAWRGEEIDLILRIPLGRKVYLDEELWQILDRDRYRFRYGVAGKEYIMLESGLENIKKETERIVIE